MKVGFKIAVALLVVIASIVASSMLVFSDSISYVNEEISFMFLDIVFLKLFLKI